MAGRSSSMPRHHHHGDASVPTASVSGAKARAGAGAVGRPPTRSHSQRHIRSQQHIRRSYHRRSLSESERTHQPGCGQLTGEAVGGLATVSCFLPCAVVEVAVLATVRAPVALCRRAVRASRHRRSASVGEAEMAKLREEAGRADKLGGTPVEWPAVPPADDAKELEKKVWASFRDSGFGRSPPQLADDNS